jgi:hypothetical protein
MAKAAKAVWVRKYFTEALDDHERLRQVLSLSGRGISVLPHFPQMQRALDKDEKTVKASEQMAKAAQEEIERGFATLHGFGVLAMWSWFESFIVDFVVLYVEKRPSCIRNIEGRKLKVDLSEYVKLRGQERARYIVDTIDREASGPLRNGLGRFDGLLNAVGLSVPVGPDCRRDIFELQQVRNCLSHRFGVIDKRLAVSCPWLNKKVGDRLQVSAKDLSRYGSATVQYLLLLLYEVGDELGEGFRAAGEAAKIEQDAGEQSENEPRSIPNETDEQKHG